MSRQHHEERATSGAELIRDRGSQTHHPMERILHVLTILLFIAVVVAPAATPKKRLTPVLINQPDLFVSRGIADLNWRPGHDQISYLRTKGSGREAVSTLYVYDVESGKESVLYSPQSGEKGEADKNNLRLSGYQWSPKGDSILLRGANGLWLLGADTGHPRRLTDDRQPEEEPTFSPAGDRIAFVKENNLYTLDLATGLEKQLTADGSETVFNGKLDWVYEEELANRATVPPYQWSPDGTKIAYLRLDDAPVPKYPLTEYLKDHVGLSEERFPQAGDPNPLPSIHVVSVQPGVYQDWKYPLNDPRAEYIAPLSSWTPDSKSICFLTLDRDQNEETVHLWNPVSSEQRVFVTEHDATWINSLDPPVFLKDSRFLWLSERDGWLHPYLYGMDGHLIRQVAGGDWAIDQPIFSNAPAIEVEERAGWVYYLSNQVDPRERHLYRVRLEGGAPERLSKDAGVHSLDLSPDGQYLVDRFSSLDTPPEPRLLKSDGTVVATLDRPEKHTGDYTLGSTEFVEVKAPDGATLYASLVRPADFDPKKKYPVIVDVYGGPHAQLIQNRWGVTSGLDQLFVQEGFLVWCLDNRGSWGRGHAFESVIYQHMGEHELADQLAGVNYLKSLPYVDPGRIGIWGWSYGGYMTLYSLTHAPEVFKCGVAGGPVTAWKYYDSIYTERYMRRPEENPEGYKNSSPLYAVDKLKGRVLLIHGADDDNVHLQNTMNFIDALVGASKAFDLYIQPGERHGFGRLPVRVYLVQRVLDFFKQNL
jgi:dipeptidyl-peptidase 4